MGCEKVSVKVVVPGAFDAKAPNGPLVVPRQAYPIWFELVVIETVTPLTVWLAG